VTNEKADELINELRAMNQHLARIEAKMSEGALVLRKEFPQHFKKDPAKVIRDRDLGR
jgi:hypothetical protein